MQLDQLNPIALRMAKTPWSFDLSKYNRVKKVRTDLDGRLADTRCVLGGTDGWSLLLYSGDTHSESYDNPEI